MIDVYFNEHDELKYDLAPYTCEHCSTMQTFDNSDELREHVLHYHDFDTRSTSAKSKLQNHSYAKHAEEHVYNFFSQTSFEYSTIEAKIFDVELSLCIDTRDALSLLDRSLLPMHQNLYDIVQETKLVIVIGVASRQIVDQVANIIVLLDHGSKKCPLQMTTYLVNNLLPDLIIDNDVLNRDDVNLQHEKKILIVDEVDIPLSYSNASSMQTSYYFTTKPFSAMSFNKCKKWRPQMQMPKTSAELNSFVNELSTISARSTPSTRTLPNERSSRAQKHTCRRCKGTFSSNNLLHNHLHGCHTPRRLGGIDTSRRRDLIDSWRKF